MFVLGLSLTIFSSGVLSQDQDELLRPTEKEWAHLSQINDLRRAGYTCPDGTVFAANPIELSWNCGLWKASRLHSKDMAEQNYFSHTGKNGSSPWDRAEAQGVNAHGENIAAGREDPLDTLEQWKLSNGHCLNMMNPSQKSVGLGHWYKQGSTYRHYWTQMLSREQPAQEDCAFEPTARPTAEPTLPPVPTMPPSGFPTIVTGPSNDETAVQEMDVYTLINEARVNGYTCNGVEYPPVDALDWNCGLWRAAKTHAVDMATNNIWGSTGSDGSSSKDRAARFGAEPNACYTYLLAGYSTGESVFDRFDDFACESFMSASMTTFGVGYARDTSSNYWNYWVISMNQETLVDGPLTDCYADGLFNTDSGPAPTDNPTAEPTPSPTNAPTRSPVVSPTPSPTREPSPAPTNAPTESPTNAPTKSPVVSPTPTPTQEPTSAPVVSPTPAPTDPVAVPTADPTQSPTDSPTASTSEVVCADINAKNACKSHSYCTWRSKKCKHMADFCRANWSNNKCVKKGCTVLTSGDCGWEADN